MVGPMPGPAAPGHARRLKWHALPSIEATLAPSPIKVHWLQWTVLLKGPQPPMCDEMKGPTPSS